MLQNASLHTHNNIHAAAPVQKYLRATGCTPVKRSITCASETCVSVVTGILTLRLCFRLILEKLHPGSGMLCNM